jgi:predicted nicotinamide N-methyase
MFCHFSSWRRFSSKRDTPMSKDARLRYQTIEIGKTDLHLCTLRDNQQFSDPQGIARALGISSASWPLFGVIWPSGLVLAHHIADYATSGKRILEIGCGIGLTSLLLNKQKRDITATDYHPEVEYFLERNARLNNDNIIAFERTDWKDSTDDLGLFDLIIGSDLLYEDEHISLLSDFMADHAKPICEIILVDPGRGRKSKFSKELLHYGFCGTHARPLHTDYLEHPFKGHILTYQRTAC